MSRDHAEVLLIRDQLRSAEWLVRAGLKMGVPVDLAHLKHVRDLRLEVLRNVSPDDFEELKAKVEQAYDQALLWGDFTLEEFV